ncbi:MAG: Thioredoxin C-1 [Candidatus Moanabacter tarae]|uniref:Thioredoxin n=1 Tax=Candidatus Moanibacter tarae TaxID=2200854 RepID=A0A2Z4AGD1_9BACT|nr:MAG: Thioredoxin C-1 [Candidatus Moanabacter tarae]|tara:strand:- start:11902 stop:12240 length:339 start_codon:yes stop_codon:yes gene_type:complete
MSSNTVEITEANFEEQVGNSEIPVLVDFWAEWCGPCKMIAPVLEEVAKERSELVKIGKVNVDHSTTLASRFEIQAIPTMLIFNSGEVKEQIVGFTSKEAILEKIDQAIQSDS